MVYGNEEVNIIQTHVNFMLGKKCSFFLIYNLPCSSIGMAKAALEAMNGFNLYGDKGANWSVVYADVV
jgi:hypothetical protein